MRIEIAAPPSAPPTSKGRLLEGLAVELLGVWNYEVVENVRVTGAELDLLCRHKLTNRSVYVECKAYRDSLSANVLKNLVGTVEGHDYAEGWLITTGMLGRDAKGYLAMWESKPEQAKREKLSVYSPDRVIDALIEAKLVIHPPHSALHPNGDVQTTLGDWTLLITEHGRFWVQTILVSGVPESVQVFAAQDGTLIKDLVLLGRLKCTDSSLRQLNFEYRALREQMEYGQIREYKAQTVVQVEHGVSWDDYRPSQPSDFVGRRSEQDKILRLLEEVRIGKATTRVFSVTGDSGMGKSSLIAKLRSRTRNLRYRNKFFLFAVDVRAATKTNYILSSLLACIRQACDAGFIGVDKSTLELSDYAEPLASKSIQKVLNRLRSDGRVVCLVFDQFEELYAKTELFSVFREAERILLSTASLQSNLVLGFAWRTDCTVQQNHPAYHLWHRLSNFRYDVSVGQLRRNEIVKAITIFERVLSNELSKELSPTIRRQIIENSRGYPWLLKKLCIHLYKTLSQGNGGSHAVEKLDVKRLFDDDKKALSGQELRYLKYIAAHAPVEFHEVLEVVGREALTGLQDKRLIVRSGDRINLYWDLFREYILTGNVPSIPFTYIPSSAIQTLLDVAEELSHRSPKSINELSALVGLSAGTVQNAVHDLAMYGAAKESNWGATLHSDIASSSRDIVLERIRSVLKDHALYLALSSFDGTSVFNIGDLVKVLKQSNPTAQHRNLTWRSYADRMGQWLCAAGLLEVDSNGWIMRDLGEAAPLYAKRWGRKKSGIRRRKAFQGEAPPERVIACLDWLSSAPEMTLADARTGGYRNALAVLVRFELVQTNVPARNSIRRTQTGVASELQVWSAAWKDPTLRQISAWLREQHSISGMEIGKRLAEERGELCTDASASRIGNGLRRWANWMIAGDEYAPPPAIPQRRSRKRHVPDASASVAAETLRSD